ncbi:hypothetical protein CCR75_008135 [Bremia lactucae]|uniref:Transmembrane protein n=1 Tax=Bremia lactucae TaxID=4779 RepID=A0A976IJB9_BRELC|nr:hypothetical protein CCR75_008135 [Bremia lactucae]
MMHPLLTCDEYNPLDANLDELEEPGTNYLQDFIVASHSTQSDTPLSHSNGYTSEESDYSVITPSDEQNYDEMSSLRAVSTSELVDVVGDLSTSDLTDVNPLQQMAVAGKGKGKTSKYRGVTQTSKSSWGAKYSAKRIMNTCKTPEEAARAYDDYLKTNFPQKFAKFANFCDKCSKFVNPLGLSQFRTECECFATPQEGFSSPEPTRAVVKKGNFFSHQTPTIKKPAPSLVPPTAPSPVGRPLTISTSTSLNLKETSGLLLDHAITTADKEDPCAKSRRSSNLFVELHNFSFTNDTEQFFAESFTDVVKMTADLSNTAMISEQQLQACAKQANLPIAVISSALDSFTSEDNLDQIIKEIGYSHSVVRNTSTEGRINFDSFGSFAATNCSSSSSSGNASEISPMSTIQVDPIMSNSEGYYGDELDEMTKYFMLENDDAAIFQQEIQASSANLQQRSTTMTQKLFYKKNHSLDFGFDNIMTRKSSCSGVVESDVKIEDTEMMNNCLTTSMHAHAGVNMPIGTAIIEIQTHFLEKYWRNDRKNIQCFPCCPEHGDYYRVRIENLQHQYKGVCRAPVKAHVSVPAHLGMSLELDNLLLLARCNSTFSRNVSLTEQQLFSAAEMKILQGISAVGVIKSLAPLANCMEGVQFDVTFHPDVWKFEFDLPKKRRHLLSTSAAPPPHGPDTSIAEDPFAAEFLYFFEVDVFHSRDKQTFERLGHSESVSFQIGNTRTLLRQRNKIEGVISRGESFLNANDSDILANADELPEKKRVKVTSCRQEAPSSSSSSENNPGSPVEMCSPQDFNEKVESDSSFLFFEGQESSLYFYNAKTDVWKDLDNNCDDQRQIFTFNYLSLVSPNHKNRNALTTNSRGATVLSTEPELNFRPESLTLSATKKTCSLVELMAYAFACVPLSALLIPLGMLLLIGFVIFPPAASSIVSTLDTMSDMELSRANRICIPGDQRMILNRLVEENTDSTGITKGGMFRFHLKGVVWSRIFYFNGANFVVSLISSVSALMLTLSAGLLYPIRPASLAIVEAACVCVLWSREYTRQSTGKSFAHSIQLANV